MVMNSILCSTCSGGPSPILKRSARVFHIPVMIICFRGADCSLLKTENGEWSLFVANSYFLFVYLQLINLPLSIRFGLFLAITLWYISCIWIRNVPVKGLIRRYDSSDTDQFWQCESSDIFAEHPELAGVLSQLCLSHIQPRAPYD